MHVVWDWNGTLFDDQHLVVAAVNASLAALDAAPIDADGYRRHFVRPLHGFYEAILGRTVDDAAIARIDEVFQAAYQDGFPTADLNREARAAVGRVGTAGATQSVASMLWHERLVSSIRRFGIDEYMLALDGNRGTAGETKAGHLMAHVARLESRYGLDRASMVAVGDITDDAEAARAAGIGCVLFDGGSQFRASLEATGFPVAGTLLEAVDLALGGATSW